jgi:hypothetical protein
MKQETGIPHRRLGVQLRVYVLALLLATFIAALHAGILFGLADLLSLFRIWAQPVLAGRLADILVIVAAISALFAAHIGETAMWAAL